jgi:transcriptional regulator with XRE-family HTH domain
VSTSFGELIGGARKAHQRSLRHLAEELDLSPSYLNDIEHNRRVPSAQVVIALASALDLDSDTLLAAAGRVGDDAEVYLKTEPSAGVLLRTVSNGGLSDEDLRKLIESAHKIIRDRDSET